VPDSTRKQRPPPSRSGSGRALEPLDPALDFLQQLWQLNHMLERVSSLMEKTLGVTAQQRLMLRCVGSFPGMTAAQLASVLHLDPGTVSTSLKRLEAKGLLVRRRDPADRRRVPLRLAASGLRLLRKGDAGTVEHAVRRLLLDVKPRQARAVRVVILELCALLADETTGSGRTTSRLPVHPRHHQ